MQHIGERIKQIREKMPLSQEGLELLTSEPKIKQSTLSRFESGERIPNQIQFEELARVFDMSVEELTDNTDMTSIKKPIKKAFKIKICVNPHCTGLGENESSDITLSGNISSKIQKNGEESFNKLITFNSVVADPDDNYCGYCGGELISECSICGELIKDTKKPFCSNCGYYLFYLCGHNTWNEESLERGLDETPPFPLHITVHGDDSDELIPSSLPSLEIFDPVRGYFSTLLIQEKIDLSLVEEVDMPERLKKYAETEDIKMVKYKSGKDHNAFPIVIYEHDKTKYITYRQRFEANCEICGPNFYDPSKKIFKSAYDYDFNV